MEKPDHGSMVAAAHGVARSPHWPSVERAVRDASPMCAGCDPDQPEEHIGLQVHHKYVSFHIAVLLGRPDLELDPRNLIVFGETEHDKPSPDHHLTLGHLRDFRRDCNPWVDEDTERLRGKSTAEIEADPVFLQHVHDAPPPWNEWDLARKQAKYDELMQKLPPDPALVAKYNLTIGARPE